jgi:hypothetical protein
VSPFGAAERTWKPFNPLLGETFELEGLGGNVAFMAEQVSSCIACVRAGICDVAFMAEQGSGVLCCCTWKQWF